MPAELRQYRTSVPDRATWRQRHAVTDGEKVLFAVGNATRRKGVERFVRDVPSRMTRGDYRDFIISTGKERHPIEAAIRQSASSDRIARLALRYRDLFDTLIARGSTER